MFIGTHLIQIRLIIIYSKNNTTLHSATHDFDTHPGKATIKYTNVQISTLLFSSHSPFKLQWNQLHHSTQTHELSYLQGDALLTVQEASNYELYIMHSKGT